MSAAALLKNNCVTDITVLCLSPHADDILHIACHWVAMSFDNLTVVYHALGILLPQDKLTKNIVKLGKALSTSTW